MIPISVRALAAALAAAAAGAACAPGDSSGSASEIDVVATPAPLAEAVREIAGARLSVADLIPPGVEPHDFEPDASQVATIERAALVIVIEGLQPAIERAAAGRRGPTELLGSQGDPHQWLDPPAWARAIPRIVAALEGVDPGGARVFSERAGALLARLGALDADYRAGLQECRRRTFVVAHSAFGRLAARYGLVQEAIGGIAPEAEPDPKRLAELRALVLAEGISTIFAEPLAPSRAVEALARETGAAVETLDPIESIQGTATYDSLMRANLRALRTALGCAA